MNTPIPSTQHTATLAERIKTSIEQLATETDEARRSAQFLAYLDQMSKFHTYSLGNVILIGSQFPSATRVAGAQTWFKLGRHIKRGERGISILAPFRVPDPEDPIRSKLFFKTVHVFDLSQTDGAALCNLDATPTETSALIHARLMDWLAGQAYSMQFVEDMNGAVGRINYQSRLVSLLPTAGTAVLVHECAHLILHSQGKETPVISLQERETEAEATAYVVGRHFGLETKSPMYLAVWSTPEVIRASLGRVQQAANQLIQAIEPQPRKEVQVH